AVIFDAVALVLTWLSIKRVTHAAGDAAGPESRHHDRSAAGLGTMTVILMQDMYFGMTSILLCRLMLDLRQTNSKDFRDGTYISHTLTAMVFEGPIRQEGIEDQEDSFGSEDIDGADDEVETP
ncbi:hypothetical protein EVJ58_g10410, partial [Rhodofomes roseus]